MPADRLLTTVLRAFQGPPDPSQTNKILSTTTSLLTTLSNPLNVTLLTSQLLIAPAIWDQVDDGLRTCLRIISIFNTAAITVRKHALEGKNVMQPRQLHGGGLSCDDWAKAVVKGADDRSQRWQHVLVICGVLLGMKSQNRQALSHGLRTTLEGALVTAANLALEESPSLGGLESDSVVLALNHAFPLLSDVIRAGLDYDRFLMVTIKTITSVEGYQEGYFLEAIDYDVKQYQENQFDWSSKSASFLQMQKLATKPLITSMGPLSRLVAHAVEQVKNPLLLVEVRHHLLEFSNRLRTGWQRNKLSELDPSEEETYLTADTQRVTLPVLWQVLKSAMFATVVILRAIIGRTLIDPVLSGRDTVPWTASQSLLVLQNIHFISSRMGSNAFSAYTFVYMTSVDILSQYPVEAREYLKSILPEAAGHIPDHPLLRNSDLFYLNTTEHFTLILSPADNEILIATPASPYLNPTANKNLLEIFEAAHSAMLAVFAAPQNAEITAKLIPFYVDSLFSSFPINLSPRQFRFAFKSLLQITTPPSPLSASQPQLSETLLELLHHRALSAPPTPLPPALLIKSTEDAQAQSTSPPLSEQAVLALTLLDSMSNLPLNILEEWLSLSAELINKIDDGTMREHCKTRFWEMLESGEMDVERSAVCVGWWSTKGGREQVLFGRQKLEGPFMSGGLGNKDGSRL
ncbi:peroxin 8-like protein [Phlyctema vagabunda]|uniref:Peroxin 8-like protein n=1 Tax=Phlyctema vagabunda TaxID=108571 RepID=A0ABR4P1Y0_9HELO